MPRHEALRPQYRWWIPLTVIAVALALVLMILLMDREQNNLESLPKRPPANRRNRTSSSPRSRILSRRISATSTLTMTIPLADGPVDAPVTLVVFSDYQCPYCAAWSQDTLPTMLDYVDSGDLRIEWREVNVFGSDRQAAEAAYAAALQDKPSESRELFAGGKPRSPEELSPEALTSVAADIGLDIDQFEEDMNSSETAEAVDKNAAMGTELGAFSTPTSSSTLSPTSGPSPPASSSTPSKRNWKERTDGHRIAQRLHRRRASLCSAPARPCCCRPSSAPQSASGHDCCSTAASSYGGMLLVLIPLGMGAGTLGALFTAYRGTIVLVASAHPRRSRHRPVLRLRLRPR